MGERNDQDLTQGQLLAELAAAREEQRFLTDALENALARIERAEAANRAKDEFLATLSHELRTPLNAILGWAQMLVKSELDPSTWRRAVLSIERNTKLQARLIEELLDVSRIIAGKLRIERRVVNLVPLIATALDTVRQAALDKGVQLESSVGQISELISGDAARLQQIIGNLLTNAIKFTPRGGKVELRVEQMAGKIRLQVIDTGRGIPPHLLPHIFERFRQGDIRANGGLGLGLTISKHLVELHGGVISAESDGEGRGARFLVELPVLSAVERGVVERVAHIRPQGTMDALPSLAGVSVVVVDDEPDARDLMGTMLRHFGAKVRLASSAAEALQLVLELPPDVLVSDIAMPAQDGYELITRIRALELEHSWRVCAVAVTAYATRQDQERALEAGFQRHLAKPIEAPDLITAVAALAQENRARSASKQDAAPAV